MKILVATPVHSNRVDYRYMISLINSFRFLAKSKIDVSLKFHQGSLINRSRNELVSLFLENPHNTHLLFIDSDIFDFDKGCLERIILSGRDVVGGIYPTKQIHKDRLKLLYKNFPDSDHKEIFSSCYQYNINIDKSLFAVNEEAKNNDGFLSVSQLATGLLLIKRTVFDKMIEAYPERKYSPYPDQKEFQSGNLYNFFDSYIDKETNEYLSEDYGFCKLWKKLGGEIYADSKSKLSHAGTFDYEGSFIDMVNKFVG
jgi:hypothetical protein